MKNWAAEAEKMVWGAAVEAIMPIARPLGRYVINKTGFHLPTQEELDTLIMEQSELWPKEGL